jgi:hypothetical protein
LRARGGVSHGAVAITMAVMVSIVMVVLPSGILSGPSPTSASTSTSVSSVTISSIVSEKSSSSGASNPTAETSNSTLGLELVLSVNSTMIPSEDAISISSWVQNTRPTANNLTAAKDWPISGLSSGPCGPAWYPVGVTVLRGNYGMQNVSDGRRIFIWPIISCPAEASPNVTSYSFLPKSDMASYSWDLRSSTAPIPLTVTAAPFAANGTGLYSSLGSTSALPSSYTLVAADEWGQAVLLHFEVTPSDNLPRAGNFLSSGRGCSPGPCDAQRLSDALVFGCLRAAATPSGCSEVWSSGLRYSASPIINYTVTVWYPSYNQPGEQASANCMYTVDPVGTLNIPPAIPSFGYCFPINSTAFVVSLP